jgi:hypothetical protein
VLIRRLRWKGGESASEVSVVTGYHSKTRYRKVVVEYLTRYSRWGRGPGRSEPFSVRFFSRHVTSGGEQHEFEHARALPSNKAHEQEDGASPHESSDATY